jgi:hypothetical protein
MGGAFPTILNTKFELRDARCCLDRIDSCQKIVNIHTVDVSWKLLCGYHAPVPPRLRDFSNIPRVR